MYFFELFFIPQCKIIFQCVHQTIDRLNVSRGDGKNRLGIHETDVYRLSCMFHYAILLLLHDKHPYWRTCQGSQVATTRARSTIKRRFSVRNVFPIEFSVNHMPQQHFTTPLRVEISHPLITGFQQMPTNRMIRDTKERNLFVLRIFTLKKPYDIVSRMSNLQNRRIPIVGIRSHVLHQISVITSVTNPCVDIIVFCTPHM